MVPVGPPTPGVGVDGVQGVPGVPREEVKKKNSNYFPLSYSVYMS